MSEPFEIEITDKKRDCFYNLKGTYESLADGKAFDYSIDCRNSSFRGFGGSVDNRLPEIALIPLELNFSVHILDAINKMVQGEKNEYEKGWK